MKKTLIASLFVFFAVSPLVSSTHAHPGRTAADGCHYCRTNCDSWGVPWNERHCHGGYSAPVVEQPVQQIIPTAIPTRVYIPPTRIPTRIPTKTPTPTLTNTPTPTASATPTVKPTKKPEVKQAQTVAPQVKQGFLAWFFSLFRR
jgi:hypothetical protein